MLVLFGVTDHVRHVFFEDTLSVCRDQAARTCLKKKKFNLQSRQRAIKPDVTQLSDRSQCKAAPAVSKLTVSAIREYEHVGTSQTCAESITGDRCLTHASEICLRPGS